MVKRKSLLLTTGWGEKVDNKTRKTVYTVKGVFNYGEWIRLENDINIKTSDVKISKYGSGLNFQLAIRKTKDNIEKKDKMRKLNKKEQKVVEMKSQRTIDNAWN